MQRQCLKFGRHCWLVQQREVQKDSEILKSTNRLAATQRGARTSAPPQSTSVVTEP
jgi:hypothetical protein